MNNMQRDFKRKSKLRCMADGGSVYREDVSGVPTFTDRRAASSTAKPYKPKVAAAPTPMPASPATNVNKFTQFERTSGRVAPVVLPTASVEKPYYANPAPSRLSLQDIGSNIDRFSRFEQLAGRSGYADGGEVEKPVGLAERLKRRGRDLDSQIDEMVRQPPPPPKSKQDMRSQKGMKHGGEVDGPGGPTDDEIPVMLSDGEYVLPADTVEKIGVKALDALRAATHTPVRKQRKLREMADGGAPTPEELAKRRAYRQASAVAGTGDVANARNMVRSEFAANRAPAAAPAQPTAPAATPAQPGLLSRGLRALGRAAAPVGVYFGAQQVADETKAGGMLDGQRGSGVKVRVMRPDGGYDEYRDQARPVNPNPFDPSSMEARSPDFRTASPTRVSAEEATQRQSFFGAPVESGNAGSEPTTAAASKPATAEQPAATDLTKPAVAGETATGRKIRELNGSLDNLTAGQAPANGFELDRRYSTGDASVFGRANPDFKGDPSKQAAREFVGVGKPEDPSVVEARNKAQSDALQRLRLRNIGNGGGGRQVRYPDNSRDINERFDKRASELRSIFGNPRAQGNLAKHLVNLEALRDKALQGDAAAAAQLRGQDIAASTQRRGQDMNYDAVMQRLGSEEGRYFLDAAAKAQEEAASRNAAQQKEYMSLVEKGAANLRELAAGRYDDEEGQALQAFIQGAPEEIVRGLAGAPGDARAHAFEQFVRLYEQNKKINAGSSRQSSQLDVPTRIRDIEFGDLGNMNTADWLQGYGPLSWFKPEFGQVVETKGGRRVQLSELGDSLDEAELLDRQLRAAQGQ